MRYSKVFSVEISMTEVRDHVDFGDFTKSQQRKMVKEELAQTWEGIISGENGGMALDWKHVFFNALIKYYGCKPKQKFIDNY